MGRQRCITTALRGQAVGLGGRGRRHMTLRQRTYDISDSGDAISDLKGFESEGLSYTIATTTRPRPWIKPSAGGVWKPGTIEVEHRWHSPEVVHNAEALGSAVAQTNGTVQPEQNWKEKAYAKPEGQRPAELDQEEQKRQAAHERRTRNSRIRKRQNGIHSCESLVEQWREEISRINKGGQNRVEAEIQALATLSDLRSACRNFSQALLQMEPSLSFTDTLSDRISSQGLMDVLLDDEIGSQLKDLSLVTLDFIEDLLRSLGLPDTLEVLAPAKDVFQRTLLETITDVGHAQASNDRIAVEELHNPFNTLLDILLSDEDSQLEGSLLNLLEEVNVALGQNEGFGAEGPILAGLEWVDQYIRSREFPTLDNIAGEPFIKVLQPLAVEHGWQPDIERRKIQEQAAYAAPRPYATPSHEHDSPESAVAFDTQNASTRTGEKSVDSSFAHPSPELVALFIVLRNLLVDAGYHIHAVLGAARILIGKPQNRTSAKPEVNKTRDQNKSFQRIESTETRVPVKATSSSKSDLELDSASICARPTTQNLTKIAGFETLAGNNPLAQLKRGQYRRGEAKRITVLANFQRGAHSKSAARTVAISKTKRKVIGKTVHKKAKMITKKAISRKSSIARKEETRLMSLKESTPEPAIILSSPSDQVAEELNVDLRIADLHDTPTATAVGNALKPTMPKRSAVSQAAALESQEEPEQEEDSYVPLDYQIPSDKMAEALNAPPTSILSYWSFDKYRSSQGASIPLHYCRKLETSETVAKLFVGKPVLGCDIEWKIAAKEKHGIKANVSVIQIACEDRIALFHLALHKGDNPEDVLSPTLKQILESPDVLKCGVAIALDFTRMQKHLGIKTRSIFELSHLHKLVLFGNTIPELVNKKLVGLASQAQLHLGLPLYKGDERVSDWSRTLNMSQCKYAADDAYASYRVFEALKEKWFEMDPRPPFPACAELGLPIQLAPRQVSEASESDGDSMVVDSSDKDDVVVLKRELAALDVDETASEDSYGDNAFDALTAEQLKKLEGSRASTQTSNLSEHQASEATEIKDLSQDTVRYPVLPLEYSEPQSRFVGRLGLERCFQASAGHHNDTSPPSAAEQPKLDQLNVDSEGVVPEPETDIPLARSIRQELSVKAGKWAQRTVQRKSADAKRGNKSNGIVTFPALRAYYLWEHEKLGCKEIGHVLRDPPLKPSTVAAYVAESLQFGDLEWSDVARLKRLVEEIPFQAKGRYWRIRKAAAEAGDP